MKIFIDFDDVLFNTKRFKKDIEGIFAKHGISKDVFEKYYYHQSGENDQGVYDPEKQLTEVERMLGADLSNLKIELEEFLEKTSEYVFPGAVDFLKSFRKEELFILSFGSKDFQKLKIEKTGLGNYFERIIITDERKGEALKDLVEKEEINISQGEEVYFIDDRCKFLDELKKFFPQSITFLMKHREGRYADEANGNCDYEIEELGEFIEILSEKESREIKNSLKPIIK